MILPTDLVVDERVVQKYRLFVSHVGDVSHGIFDVTTFEVLRSLDGKVGCMPENNFWYRLAAQQVHYSFPEPDLALVTPPVLVVIYETWLKSIASERAMKRIHREVMEKLILDHPEDAEHWQRSDELIQRWSSLGDSELSELHDLKQYLDSRLYASLRKQLLPHSIDSLFSSVSSEYFLPSGKPFSETLVLALQDTLSGKECYRELLSAHCGFRNRPVA